MRTNLLKFHLSITNIISQRREQCYGLNNLIHEFSINPLTCVPMEPVDPTIEIGFGPSHELLSGSTTARPGQAGGGACCIEQHVRLSETARLPFL